jgi:hypothetical protein
MADLVWVWFLLQLRRHLPEQNRWSVVPLRGGFHNY